VIREVVGETWRLFLARFWRTLLIIAVLLAPLELGVTLLDPDFSSVEQGWWVWVGATAAMTVVAFPWAFGAIVHDVAAGDRPLLEGYRRTGGRLPDLIASTVVTTVGILLGLVALVVPGLVLLARWGPVVPLIVLEGADWRRALARSNALVRGQTRPVMAIFVLLTGLAFGVALIPVLIGYLVLENVLGAWLATLAIDVMMVSFYAFAPFVLYRRLTS